MSNDLLFVVLMVVAAIVVIGVVCVVLAGSR